MALTLKQRFSYSKLDTLVLRGGYAWGNSQTSTYVCMLVCDKNIKVPPAEIVPIKEIRTLKIEFCPQLDLTETFLRLGDMPNLTKLHFKSCAIKEVPPEIWAVDKLTVLSFGNEGMTDNNEIETLPPEIEYLRDLREIDLHENRHFERFPPEVAKLTKLNRLNLRAFNKLPKNIELIPNLESLYLVFSGIVPAHIEPLLDRANGLKSVTVGEHYFNSFRELAEKYPNLSVSWEHTTLRGDY